MKKNSDDVVASKADEAVSDQEELSSADSADASNSADAEDPTDGLPEKMPEDKGAERPDLEAADTENVAENEESDESSASDNDAEESPADDAAESDSESDSDEEELAPEEQISALEEELVTLKADHKDELLRMQAEIQNQRKRIEAQADRGRKFALEGFAKELLEVKDSLEMGIEAAKQEGAEIAQFIEGSDLTLKKLAQSFEKNNITEIDPVDEKFNPELHEAMSQQPVEGKEPNTVIGVIQKGYSLNGRVIRPARVMVAK